MKRIKIQPFMAVPRTVGLMATLIVALAVINPATTSAQEMEFADELKQVTVVKITPSHVYQQAQLIVGEVQIIRQVMNADASARTPGVQTDKRPIHVYAKSLEVMGKVARTLSALGLAPPEIGSIPLHTVTPQEVYDSTQRILRQLARIKSKLNITQKSVVPELTTGYTPSDVYEKVWLASNLMDAVAGQVSPNLVYRNTMYVLAELDLIASAANIQLEQSAPAPLPGIGPKRVNLEGFMNLYRLANLERQLGMPPLRVANFPSGKITPADVFDTTNTMLAELARIKNSLGISKFYSQVSPPKGKKPPDVHANMRLIATQLRQLIESDQLRS